MDAFPPGNRHVRCRGRLPPVCAKRAAGAFPLHGPVADAGQPHAGPYAALACGGAGLVRRLACGGAAAGHASPGGWPCLPADSSGLRHHEPHVSSGHRGGMAGVAHGRRMRAGFRAGGRADCGMGGRAAQSRTPVFSGQRAGGAPFPGGRGNLRRPHHADGLRHHDASAGAVRPGNGGYGSCPSPADPAADGADGGHLRGASADAAAPAAAPAHSAGGRGNGHGRYGGAAAEPCLLSQRAGQPGGAGAVAGAPRRGVVPAGPGADAAAIIVPGRKKSGYAALPGKPDRVPAKPITQIHPGAPAGFSAPSAPAPRRRTVLPGPCTSRRTHCPPSAPPPTAQR